MDFYPRKAQFLPREPIALHLETEGISAEEVQITVYRLQHQVARLHVPFKNGKAEVTLPPVCEPFAGYGVEASISKGKGEEVICTTAFDVSRPDRVIRYGFLSDFSPDDKGEEDIRFMARCHLNTVQFYDWSYRHDDLVAPLEQYADMMGKHNDLSCVRQKVEACKAWGMRPLAYGAVYAASRAFWEQHTAWGFYAARNQPIRFIDVFYLMNIAKGCPWREHILAQYRRAMADVGFDGIHMDTYGFPKAALDDAGNTVYLDEEFPSLISDAKISLSSNGASPCLIFNNVGGWPAEKTQSAPQAAVYIEVWPPYERYCHLKQLILDAKRAGKPVILAAYMSPFRLDTPQRALEAYLCASFVIAVCGATHLCLGEKSGMLTQGYYADYSRLTPWQEEKIFAYQDFFVRYQELLYDDSLADVSASHMGGDNIEYRCDAPCSPWGEPGKLYLTLRQNKQKKTIALLNLCGETDDLWSLGKQPPLPQKQISLRILVERPVVNVWFATPDADFGRAVQLPYAIELTGNGTLLSVCIPSLVRCGLLWMEMEVPEASDIV